MTIISIPLSTIHKRYLASALQCFFSSQILTWTESRTFKILKQMCRHRIGQCYKLFKGGILKLEFKVSEKRSKIYQKSEISVLIQVTSIKEQNRCVKSQHNELFLTPPGTAWHKGSVRASYSVVKGSNQGTAQFHSESEKKTFQPSKGWG